jgi:hypothetical protein
MGPCPFQSLTPAQVHIFQVLWLHDDLSQDLDSLLRQVTVNERQSEEMATFGDLLNKQSGNGLLNFAVNQLQLLQVKRNRSVEQLWDLLQSLRAKHILLVHDWLEIMQLRQSLYHDGELSVVKATILKVDSIYNLVI